MQDRNHDLFYDFLYEKEVQMKNINWLGWAFFLLLSGVALRGIPIRHDFEQEGKYGNTIPLKIQIDHDWKSYAKLHVDLENRQSGTMYHR